MLLLVIVVLVQCFITAEVESTATVVGCVSSKQAESIFEEVSRLFENVALLDAIQGLVSCNASETPLDAMEHCTSGFKDKYMEKVKLLQSEAAIAAEDIREANQNRVKQVEVARIFEETWKKMKKIWSNHNKILCALDMFFKDSIMQTSAYIGHLIRSGDDEIKWDNVKITRVLASTADTTLGVMETMPSSMKDVIKSVLIEILWINVASQAYSAAKDTSMERVLELDNRLYKRFARFSELSISGDIRRTSKIRFDTMVVGFEEAQEYASKTNATLKKLKEVAAGLNKASRYVSCAENKRIAAKVLKDLEQVTTNLKNNEAKFAAEYLEKINQYYRNTFKPIISTFELDQAMQVIKDTLPERRNSVLDETYRFLNNFEILATSNGLGSLYKHWFLFLNETVKRIDIMVEYSGCHAKIFKLMGSIIQRCKDGEGDFDGIYQRVTSSIQVNSQECRDASMLEAPSKEDIKQMVENAAKQLGYNADCAQNQKRRDNQQSNWEDTYEEDDDDGVSKGHLSPTQKLMVCDLRSLEKPKSESQIASMVKVSRESVSAVRCMENHPAKEMFDRIHNNKLVTRFLEY